MSNALLRMLKKGQVSQCLTFSGGTGTGKTSFARVLAKKLGCDGDDYEEINAALSRGIDTIRDVQRRYKLASLSSCRVYVFDECQALTKDAQDSMLKLLEGTPEGVYMILCTTDPHKLKKTILGRCKHFKLSPLSPDHLEGLVTDIAKREKITLGSGVLEELIKVSEGSAREALQLLEKASHGHGEEEQLSLIGSLKDDPGRKLLYALMDTSTKYSEICGLIEQIDGDHEELRMRVLGWAAAFLRGKDHRKHPHAYLVISAFEGSWVEQRPSGLVRACYEVFSNRKALGK